MAEYIEREAILHEAIEGKLFVFSTQDVIRDEFVARTCYKDLAEVVRSIPAADVAPITPGRWLNYDELYALAEQELMSGALEHEECDAIINFIDAAPVIESVSVGHRDWISAKERLPEDSDDVLVVAFWAERWGVYMGWCVAEKKRWYVNTGNTCGAVNRGVPVAYWMPLPELPEMDGGAEDE